MTKPLTIDERAEWLHRKECTVCMGGVAIDDCSDSALIWAKVRHELRKAHDAGRREEREAIAELTTALAERVKLGTEEFVREDAFRTIAAIVRARGDDDG